jgi:hypothetical protein
MDIPPKGSARSELTSEPVPPPGKMPDPSPALTPVPTPSPSPAPSLTHVAMTINDVIFDVLTIKVSTVQKSVRSQTVLHPKAECATLNKNERNDFYERATAKHHKLLDLFSLAITSEDKLDDTYNLNFLIDHMISFHGGYETGDAFKICQLGSRPHFWGPSYQWRIYSNLSIESVAQSNEFYHTYVADKTFTDNLKPTLDYMKNNVTKNLLNKVLEKYKPFQEKQKGGPSFFKLMINPLFVKYGICSEAIIRASGKI